MRFIILGVTGLIVVSAFVFWRQQPVPNPAGTLQPQATDEMRENPPAHPIPPEVRPKSTATAVAGEEMVDDGESVPVHQSAYDGPDPAIFDNSDYAFYDTALLTELAESGDVTAMQVLGMRFFTTEASDENRQKAKQWMLEAAAHGARHYPFQTMAASAGYELQLALLGRLTLPEEQQREALVETLSFGRLATMRGNPVLETKLDHTYFQGYGITLSAEEAAEVSRRAEMKYAELENRRAELGLGPFEDSTDTRQ